MLQLIVVVSVSIVFSLCIAAAMGLIAGLVTAAAGSEDHSGTGKTVIWAVSAGAALAGIRALSDIAAPSLGPDWSGFGPGASWIPFVSAALMPVVNFIRQVLILSLVFHLAGWMRRIHPAVVLTGFGLIMAGSSSIETIPSWLLSGVALGLVLAASYLLLFKYQPNLIPITFGMIAIMSALKAGLRQTFPALLPGSIAAVVVIALLAWWWFRMTSRVSKPRA